MDCQVWLDCSKRLKLVPALSTCKYQVLQYNPQIAFSEYDFCCHSLKFTEQQL